jgi:hypothetical protein
MAEKAKIELKSEIKPFPTPGASLPVSAIGQSSDLVERAVSTGYALARDTRAEVLQRSLAFVDFIEGTQQSALKLVRDVMSRADKIVLDAVDTSENLSVGVLRATRDALVGVTHFAESLPKMRVKAAVVTSS